MAAVTDAEKLYEKAGGEIAGHAGEAVKQTRQQYREGNMTRSEYQQDQKGSVLERAVNKVENLKDHRDERTRTKYEKFKNRSETAKMRAEMRAAHLKPLKALAGTSFGKLALLGAGMWVLMNGGLSLPMKALSNMAAGLAGGGLVSWLTHPHHPLEAANEAVDHKNHKLAEGNKEMTEKGENPFKNSYDQLESAKAQAAQNTINDQEKANSKTKQSSKEDENAVQDEL